jgi:23S rRNA (cytosine1962-C5)-methyltransferase
MPLLRVPDRKPIRLQLRRDLVRSIKRGHPWVYADALRECPPAPPGTRAVLLDNRGGREIGRGFYDPQGSIALRVCTTQREERLTDSWAAERMQRAITLRQGQYNPDTTAYRLFNGEGDGLPGLVCDRYTDAAVLQLDGEAAGNFWHAPGIANWLGEKLGLNLVVERLPGNQPPRTQVLLGSKPGKPVQFLEHGLRFSADLFHGQKTGFYLDQRENRQRMRAYAAGKRVLNVFGYTGGFSVYAGMAGAAHVTTVDSAQPALDAADNHWTLNDLPPDKHNTVRADAFEFLRAAQQKRKTWDVVIIDPPSFAPSQAAVPKALNAYEKLIAAGASVTAADGILAVGSCSSHVSLDDFYHACQEGISKARRQAAALGIYTQPADHPVPLAMPEFRYLKFIVMQLND